ncbi:transcription factor of the MADS box [Actinomortierella ambigua]|nr:transcription factor of the MADS box [Actinomortierella ambigua]
MSTAATRKGGSSSVLDMGSGDNSGQQDNNSSNGKRKFEEDEDDDDDDDDDRPKNEKRAGRRKIKIEYIEDKSRRHITFSKRKSGIMKKAYELSTLTGTQVLLLVVSETGLVYTFTTPKLQPLVTRPEGKNLIQACLHAPDKEPTPEPDSNGQEYEASKSPAGEGNDASDYDTKAGILSQTPGSPAAAHSPVPGGGAAGGGQAAPQHPGSSGMPPASSGGQYPTPPSANFQGYPPPFGHVPMGGVHPFPGQPYNYPNVPNFPPPPGAPGAAPGYPNYWPPEQAGGAAGQPPQQQSGARDAVQGGRKASK